MRYSFFAASMTTRICCDRCRGLNMPARSMAMPWRALVSPAADRLPYGSIRPVRRVSLADVSTKIGGVSLTGLSSDPEHPAALPKRLAAQFASLDHRRLSYSWSPKRRSAARDWHLRPLDRGFDLPREVQLFDALCGVTARVIWLRTASRHNGSEAPRCPE